MTTTAPVPRRMPMLSKSRYTAGLQCVKRLWLESFAPEAATPTSEAQEAIFASGTAAGSFAQQLYPGGVNVDEDYLHHDEAVERTRGLLRDPNVRAIYEAAFTEDDIRIRADILVRSWGGAWDLVEVKSSTSVKDIYIDDVAVQMHVLAQAGLWVNRVGVAHINNRYEYPGGPHEAHELFTVTNVTELARKRLAEVPGRLEELRRGLASESEPVIDIGAHCGKPYTCQFVAYCRRGEPEWPIDSLPGLPAKRVQRLRNEGYRSILSLPASETLNALQERVREAVLTQQPWVAPDLAETLAGLRYPVHFIDFETVAPWLPRWPGTRPYQAFPFQWSDHMMREDGTVDHAEFLAEGSDDPRRPFAETLIERLRGAGTLVVYTGYERQQLSALRDALPDLAPALDAILEVPQFDLHRVIREGYYHPGFLGSFSLKAVLPVVVPALAYSDLAIQRGDVAAAEFQRLWDDDLPDGTRAQIRADLLAYCERDTEAMVRLVEALRELVQRD